MNTPVFDFNLIFKNVQIRTIFYKFCKFANYSFMSVKKYQYYKTINKKLNLVLLYDFFLNIVNKYAVHKINGIVSPFSSHSMNPSVVYSPINFIFLILRNQKTLLLYESSLFVLITCIWSFQCLIMFNSSFYGRPCNIFLCSYKEVPWFQMYAIDQTIHNFTINIKVFRFYIIWTSVSLKMKVTSN